METFDPLTIPLQGQQLIEASAGTGKTYSIALLYLRLILEGDFDVDNILVVTFTTSATEELRQRIRERLREALDLLEQAGNNPVECKDQVLEDLLNLFQDRPKRKQRLADTLIRMDESAVFTIHGFCQRMLQDHAFESGEPFAIEFIETEKELRSEIVRDFWRQRFYPVSATETAWATATWGGPEGLAAVLNMLLTQSQVKCIPDVSAEEIERLREQSRNSLQAVLENWKERSGEVENILRNDSCLSRNKKSGYGGDRVDVALAGMKELAAHKDAPWLMPPAVELLASSEMAGKLIGKKIIPEHTFFTLFDAFFQGNAEFLRLARIHVVISAYRYLREELMIRKRDHGQMYFDDLLIRLDSVISGPDRAGLVKRIQNRYGVALVDEFQDTDPLQYRIFQTLFGKRIRPGLFMIGDPKQSIYSFRGADVFAYILAKNNPANTAAFTMNTNYRSTAAMVQAVNRLFDSEASFVFEKDIPFNRVKSGGKADAEPFVVHDATPLPLQAMLLPVKKFAAKNKQSIAKGRAEDAAARWTAFEIARLLELGKKGQAKIGERPLAGGDMAVLVRTHREAEMIQRELTRKRITSVYYSQDSVFESAEARELHVVLSALLDLTVTSRVNAALATPLFGVDALDLVQLQSDPSRWDRMTATLEEYHLCWRDQGVAAMVQKLFSAEQVVQRLISLAGGERKLTNYLHLSELLEEASEKQLGMDGLVSWFGLQRHDSDEAGESCQLRLESDENLVRIVTVHKAKGLEYPVVFLPFIWNCRQVKNDDILSFHQPGSLEYVIDIGTGQQQNFLQAEQERLAEDLRLLYVAVTRARYCCYFSWGRINSMEKSAMAWLLHRKEPDQEPLFPSLTEEQIDQDISVLNREEKIVDIISFPQDVGDEIAGFEDPSKPLSVKIFQGNIDRGWSISSYSKIARTEMHKTRTGETEHRHEEHAVDTGVKSVFSFPKGADAGTCLHNILEQLDFCRYEDGKLLELAREQLLRNGLDPEWAPFVRQWVESVLATPLDVSADLLLKALDSDAQLKEMGFYFAMQGFNVSRLNTILSDFGFTPVQTKDHELSGLMRGFIDLVFFHKGRYYLADYKSNFLGSSQNDYRAELLSEAMEGHRYDLQYLIYIVALHRYLATRMNNYDYSTHFGGVYYLFLRGMHPESPVPGSGVYYTKPPRDMIEQLNTCFGAVGVE